MNHSVFRSFQIHLLLWQLRLAQRCEFKTELGKNGGTFVNTCRWDLENAPGFNSTKTIWQCGNVEGHNKRDLNCSYTMDTTKKKEEIMDMVETMTIFSLCHFNNIYTIFLKCYRVKGTLTHRC